MAHEFVILNNGVLQTYTEFEQIPQRFDNVVRFVPEIPEGPHTHEQHHEIELWNDKLQQLMERERASSN